MVHRDQVQMHERHLLGFGDLLGPADIAIVFSLTFFDGLPRAMRDGRYEDWRHSLGLSIVHILPQVPAVGVYDFRLLRLRMNDLAGFFADAAERAAGPLRIVGGDAVVVAHL